MNLELFPAEEKNMLRFESLARAKGYRVIAGVDEAGRGPLAGPVVASAVILHPGQLIAGVDDSKKLTEKKRELLFDRIMAEALSVGVGVSDASVVDQINILQATLGAMESSVAALSVSPDCILIDGISKTSLPIQQICVKKGDSLSASIAAASIIAKVTRDRMMLEFDREYPGYGFASHKGYGARSHLEAIRRLGPSKIHRLTFGGVKEYVSHMKG